ncbi:MAG TPA: hypothetical protein VGD48_25180 [Kutzneria sp.]
MLVLLAHVAVAMLITYGLPDWIGYGLGAGFIVFAGSTLGERWRRADTASKR